MTSLWGLTAASGLPASRFAADATAALPLRALHGATTLGLPLSACRNRAVLIQGATQLATAAAVLELDGVARRIVLCPADFDPVHLGAVIAQAGVEIVLTGPGQAAGGVAGPRAAACGLPALPGSSPARDIATEWLLFTSGTSGRPKMVVHDLASLTGALAPARATPSGAAAVWSTFYDIRRYGGLQILLRALLGGGSMVLSDAAEPVDAYLRRAAAAGVTHISGTPTHWRRVLMSAPRPGIDPAYIRLSGEVADQAILDQLGRAFPRAAISHAFASTEAGVGFEVADGLAGFPAKLIGENNGPVELRVRNGALHIRSDRTAKRYEGGHGPRGDDGFVDTGDLLDLRDDRYYFAGRRQGQINVGGQKVHPEEVEAAINRHPAVRMSLVHGRPNPITGAIVVAEVVLRHDHGARPFQLVRQQIFELCRASLPEYKVPAVLREVAALSIAASGKLARS